MKKRDINASPKKFIATNAFIFAGSFSVGTIKAGFDLKRVLEIADDQLENNAFYFKKNVEDVPVILPREWENDDYLAKLKSESIDLMCANCPCSSLSQINRHAAVDGKNNVHFYRLFNVFNKVEPKVFIIENAPTLITLGLPILKDLVKELGSKYRFTVVRDRAGNHEVPMLRMRTLVVGWSKKHFSKIPVIKQDAHERVTVKDTLEDLYSYDADDNKSRTSDDISDLYKHALPDKALMMSLAEQYISDNKFKTMIDERLGDSPSHYREVKRIAEAMKSGKNFWDKSPHKLVEDHLFPSLTSVSEYLHPTKDRMLNLRELARVMNYPDGYDFTDPKHECKIPVTQAIAQGVPANFGKYIATQARLGLEGKLETLDDESIDVVFQHHIKHAYETFTREQFLEVEKLDKDKMVKKLED